MVGEYVSVVMQALILYAILGWAAFVLGIYFGHLRAVAKHSAKRHLITSWLLVIAGFLLLLGGYLADEHPISIDSPNDKILLIVLGAITAVSAVPAGAAYSILEKKHWRALIPPVTGIIAQEFLYGSIWLAQYRKW